MGKSIQYPEMLSPMNIPYFDHGDNLATTIKNSSARRNMSKWHFFWRKIKNIILFRLAYFCPFNSWRIRMHRWRGVHIGKNVYVGQHCVIDNAYPEYIYIEDNVGLAGEITILAHTNPYIHFENILASQVAPVLIKDGAIVSVRSVVLLGVTIGTKSIVSAGTIVDKDVPDYTFVRGNPMEIVTEYSHFV